MKFAIVKEVTLEISKPLRILNRVEDYINEQLSKRNYGNGIETLFVGVNCVNPKLGRAHKDFQTGLVIEKKYTKSKKVLGFTMKLNYGEIKNAASDEEVINIFAKGLFNSYSEIDSLNIKDFEIGKFYNDLKELLQDLAWLKETYQEKVFHYKLPSKSKTQFTEDEKMPLNFFWELIEKARIDSKLNLYQQIEIITYRLSKTTEKEIIGFECTLRELLIKAYHYNVMAVQKIVEGSVSDDSFLYFRCKLILYGGITFGNAINNPDYIFERIDSNVSGEPLLMAADTAFKMKYGESTDKLLPRDFASEVIDYNFGEHIVQGNDWNEAEIPKLYPKLWKAYN